MQRAVLKVSVETVQQLCTMTLHRPCHSIDTLEAALQEVENIPAYLPNCLELKDVVTKAKKWLHEAETLQVKPNHFCV